MNEQNHGTDHVIDETIREAISRLEAERTRVTSRLDARLRQLRAMLEADESTTPPRERTARPVPTPSKDRDQEPDVAPRGETQAKVFAYLQKHPDAGYQELADGIFGVRDQLTFNKLRSTVWAMKKGHWISGEAGAWKLGTGKGTA